MSYQEKLMLAKLKGMADGHVRVAKVLVRAAFKADRSRYGDYGRGYRDARRRKAVDHLRDMRDIQRAVHELCEGMGYHVR